MHNIIPIQDFENAALNAYRDIKERDLRGRDGHFIAEGKVVIERLLRSDFYEPLSLLTTPSRLPVLLPLILDSKLPLYVVSQDMMDQVAGFSIHRGYLAVGRKLSANDDFGQWARLNSNSHLRLIILSGIANTDNMGGVFRNAAAFGIDAVILDKSCCDPLYRKAIRVSVGGVFHLPHFRLDDWQDRIFEHQIQPLALSPSGAISIDSLTPPDRYALVIGTEGMGLSDSIMASMPTVRVEMAAGFDSLNLATTSGIALYALSRNHQT